MDIRKIRTEELKIGNFAFMDMTSYEEMEWHGQPVLFDGIVFGFCLKGTLSFRINYKELHIATDEMFICLPQHLFTATGCSSDVMVKLLLVSSEFFYSMPVSFGFNWLKHVEVLPWLKPVDEKIEDLLGLYTLLERYNTKDEYASRIRDALMLSFILIIISLVGSSVDTTGEQVVSRQEWLTRRFFDLMSQHFRAQRQVSFYADKLCVTPKHLSAVLKNTTVRTAQEWLNEMVLVEAKRCLKTTDLSVFQISESLNFSTVSSFVRFFRQHTGCTPLKYRWR